MVTLAPHLANLSSSARLLPRSEGFSAVYVNLTGLDDALGLAAAVERFESGEAIAAWDLARVPAKSGGGAALIGGALALVAGDVAGGIDVLERLLDGPAVPPVGEGAVVLAFSDEGMLSFDLDSLAGVALLVYAYACSGRADDARRLASEAHTLVGAEAFLVLELWLLRDAKAWDELLAATSKANPKDRARFEIALLRGQAYEALGRISEAHDVYRPLADLREHDLPWPTEADRRLRGGRGVPLPPEAEPPRFAVGALGTITLQPEAVLDGQVYVAPSSRGSSSGGVDEVLALAKDESPAVALSMLEGRKAEVWTPVLAALLAAAARDADAPRRLAEVVTDPDLQPYVSEPERWMDGYVLAYVGETLIAAGDGADVFVLALAARMHAAGETNAARRWLEWAQLAGDSERLGVAAVALALAEGDVGSVLRETGGPGPTDDPSLVLQVLRARALETTGRTEAAMAAYDEARTVASGINADLELAVRFYRARLLLRLGDRQRGRAELHAIQARDHEYPGLDELLDASVVPEAPVRGRPDRAMRQAVYDRDGGCCVDCGSRFDLQYDHVLPVALGGATTVENLQILCGRCNQQKGMRL